VFIEEKTDNSRPDPINCAEPINWVKVIWLDYEKYKIKRRHIFHYYLYL
jgi:hypothetical protein